MKKVSIVIVCVCTLLGACRYSNPSREQNLRFLADTNWALQELRTPEVTITLNRPLLEMAGMSNVFRICFDQEGRGTGTAAETRYTTECEWYDDSGLLITPVIIGQSDASKKLPLKEADYFDYLSHIDSWRLGEDGSLHLYNSGNEKTPWVYLVFGR